MEKRSLGNKLEVTALELGEWFLVALTSQHSKNQIQGLRH